MANANEVWAVDEARAASMITNFVNSLKGDTVKIYDHTW
jgi:hypothetical protein